MAVILAGFRTFCRDIHRGSQWATRGWAHVVSRGRGQWVDHHLGK